VAAQNSVASLLKSYDDLAVVCKKAGLGPGNGGVGSPYVSTMLVIAGSFLVGLFGLLL
jgi:hypothetical protein